MRLHHSLEAELGADGRRGYSVLAGSRLGEDTLLADPLGEEDLSDGVVDLYRSRVVSSSSPRRNDQKLTLCDPVWFKSSLLNQILAPPAISLNRLAS